MTGSAAASRKRRHLDGLGRHTQLAILYRAQAGICAGCGRSIRKRMGRPEDALAPTFDHVVTRASGGGNGIRNGLLKHRACNSARADRPPTGCDLLWHEVVRVKLARARQNRRKNARHAKRAERNKQARNGDAQP